MASSREMRSILEHLIRYKLYEKSRKIFFDVHFIKYTNFETTQKVKLLFRRWQAAGNYSHIFIVIIRSS